MRARYPILRRFRLPLLALYSVCLVCAIIASHTRPAELPDFIPGIGKVLHFTGFAGLATLLVLMLAGFGELRLARIVWTLLFLGAYAALDEYTQRWFDRTPAVGDWLIDCSGTVLAVVVWEVVLGWSAARRKRILTLRFRRPDVRVESDITPNPPA